MWGVRNEAGTLTGRPQLHCTGVEDSRRTPRGHTPRCPRTPVARSRLDTLAAHVVVVARPVAALELAEVPPLLSRRTASRRRRRTRSPSTGRGAMTMGVAEVLTDQCAASASDGALLAELSTAVVAKPDVAADARRGRAVVVRTDAAVDVPPNDVVEALDGAAVPEVETQRDAVAEAETQRDAVAEEETQRDAVAEVETQRDAVAVVETQRDAVVEAMALDVAVVKTQRDGVGVVETPQDAVVAALVDAVAMGTATCPCHEACRAQMRRGRWQKSCQSSSSCGPHRSALAPSRHPRSHRKTPHRRRLAVDDPPPMRP
jgi:hypothetical protein